MKIKPKLLAFSAIWSQGNHTYRIKIPTLYKIKKLTKVVAFVESVHEALECTIQVKNFEKSFHVVLYIVTYKVFYLLLCLWWIKAKCVTTQMKAIELRFPSGSIYNTVLSFQSVV